ncbi:hypothetical protein TrST_g8691 [Triparma strigata]|uniref:PLOD1-3-like GT domain-containing protein n=1 Tax=Triparma strigata TaxID=1606541 RepID=A0A9W7BTI6_9STRA|nr:hypothetical protein TrST_g8691 [Triparma strigata]
MSSLSSAATILPSRYPLPHTFHLSITLDNAVQQVPFTIIETADSTDPRDALAAASMFCRTHNLPTPSCDASVTLNLVDEGAPLSTPSTNTPLTDSQVPVLIETAQYFSNAQRPAVCVSLLEVLLSADSEPLSPITRLPGESLKVYNLLAICYQQAGNPKGLEILGLIHAQNMRNSKYIKTIVDIPIDAKMEDSHHHQNSQHTFDMDIVPTLNYAVTLSRNADYPAARGILDQLISLLPPFPSPPSATDRASVFLNSALVEFDNPGSNDISMALSHGLRALQYLDASSGGSSVDKCSANLLLGKIYLSTGEALKAKAHFEAALALEPHNVELFSNLQHSERMLELSKTPRRDVHFVTFASDPDRCELKRLLRSASKYDIEVEVLGGNMPSGHWRNGLKLELLHEYASGLKSDDYLVIVDGYDVVLAGGADLFLTKFEQLTTTTSEGERSVVFQADYTFYCPLKNESISAYYAEHYPPAKTIYRYLSSGGMMGKAGDVASLVESVQSRYKDSDWDAKSDQSLFIRYLVDSHKDRNDDKDSVKIIVDHWQTVFSGNGGRVFLDFDVVGGRLHHKVTDSFPVMLHCPGLKKNQMEMKRLKEMGWEADVMDCE